MSQLYKECELRRFGHDGQVERSTRWLPADEAAVGRVITFADEPDVIWEILSAPEPALPGAVVRRLDPDGIAVLSER